MSVALSEPVIENPLTSFRTVERTPGKFESWFELHTDKMKHHGVNYVGLRFVTPDDLREMSELFAEAAIDLETAPITGLDGSTDDDEIMTTEDL